MRGMLGRLSAEREECINYVETVRIKQALGSDGFQQLAEDHRRESTGKGSSDGEKRIPQGYSLVAYGPSIRCDCHLYGDQEPI